MKSAFYMLAFLLAVIFFTCGVIPQRINYTNKIINYEHPRILEEKKEEVKKSSDAKKPGDKNSAEKKAEDKDKAAAKNAVCKSIGYFTGENTSEPRPIIKNKSGICSYIDKSCCNDKDLQIIKKWWEGDENSKDSRQKKRLENSEDIALFTSA